MSSWPLRLSSEVEPLPPFDRHCHPTLEASVGRGRNAGTQPSPNPADSSSPLWASPASSESPSYTPTPVSWSLGKEPEGHTPRELSLSPTPPRAQTPLPSSKTPCSERGTQSVYGEGGLLIFVCPDHHPLPSQRSSLRCPSRGRTTPGPMPSPWAVARLARSWVLGRRGPVASASDLPPLRSGAPQPCQAPGAFSALLVQMSEGPVPVHSPAEL